MTLRKAHGLGGKHMTTTVSQWVKTTEVVYSRNEQGGILGLAASPGDFGMVLESAFNGAIQVHFPKTGWRMWVTPEQVAALTSEEVSDALVSTLIALKSSESDRMVLVRAIQYQTKHAILEAIMPMLSPSPAKDSPEDENVEASFAPNS